MMLRLAGLVCVVLAGFGCGGLPDDGVFHCEPERRCSQLTAEGIQYVCYPDDYCRPPGAPVDGTDGGGTDGGGTDGGGTDGGGSDGGGTDGGGTDGGGTDACVPLSCSGLCGTLDNGCGTTIICGGCGTGFTCGGDNKCQPCQPTDPPDDAFADLNCDGIDGQLDGGIFLSSSGNDSAPGTKSQPVASLAVAFERARTASHKTIYVGSGTYDVGSSGMLWDSPVSLYGGYTADFSSRSAAAAPAVLQVGASGIRVTATDGGFTIERISVSAGNATGDGIPSVAMTVINTQDLALRHATLQAGNGSTGAGGLAGSTSGLPGVDGADGGSTAPASTAGAGGSATASLCSSGGGAGGGGGSHNTSPPGSGLPGVDGTSNSGSGGTPGTRYTACDNMGGCSSSCAQGSAGAGGRGGDGARGIDGSQGTAGDGTGFIDSGVWMARSGGSGLTGGGGRGGGGGGGGGAFQVYTGSSYCSFSTPGAGGGAGGSGGCGGVGGTGGRGGGASIALLLSNARVQANALTLRPGRGGNGGLGGPGAPGGRGGAGGLGGIADPTQTHTGGVGGQGGRGGDGGTGGPGGGGGGGPSVGIYCTGTSTVVHDGGITFVSGTQGPPASNGAAGLNAAAHLCPGYP
ncbi:hypothetical protein [Archangium violaceum]|uniref:hypothetical protein n=1 Tax=Archangium violaceum TaxID=83451 RepID=UPI0036DC89C8